MKNKTELSTEEKLTKEKKTDFLKSKKLKIILIIATVLIITLVASLFILHKRLSASKKETQSVSRTEDTDIVIFGDEETTTEKLDSSAMLYEIDEQMKNIEIASGDSEKDEDAEVNRDYGTNSSSLSPAASPKLTSRLTGSSVSDGAVYYSTSSSLKFVNRNFVTGLTDIDGTLFDFTSAHYPYTGYASFGSVQYYFNGNGALASLVGIDVSHHNGKIDWQQVKAAGVDFAIIRVGFRGYGEEGALKLDSRFDENMQGAAAAGIQTGVYFYSQAITVAEALQEASVAVNYSRRYNITMPIYFDTEFSNSSHSGRADSLSFNKRTDMAVAFCEAVKNAGFKAGVYASKTFFTDELNFSRLSGYEIWVAHYTSEPTDFKYDFSVWQYTPKGTVSGIPNDTDINIALYDYSSGSDMSENGSDFIFVSEDGDIAAAENADRAITAYRILRTDTLYNAAYSEIGAVSDETARQKLYDVLNSVGGLSPAADETTE